MELITGSKILVRAFDGKVLERIVVADQGEVVIITKEEEYDAARREGREPLAVGFKKKDIIQ